MAVKDRMGEKDSREFRVSRESTPLMMSSLLLLPMPAITIVFGLSSAAFLVSNSSYFVLKRMAKIEKRNKMILTNLRQLSCATHLVSHPYICTNTNTHFPLEISVFVFRFMYTDMLQF